MALSPIYYGPPDEAPANQTVAIPGHLATDQIAADDPRLITQPDPSAGGTGLFRSYTYEGGTNGATVSGLDRGLSGSTTATYSSAAAIHGVMGIQMVGASGINYEMPGQRLTAQLYGSLVAGPASGTGPVVNFDDAGISTAYGSWQVTTTDGVNFFFRASAGASAPNTTTGTQAFAIGDQFRVDLTLDSTNGISVTLAIFLRGNIEGTTPDETITASKLGTNAWPTMFRLSANATWTLTYDTLRIWYPDTAPTPYAPSTPLSGSGTLTASASPAFAVTPGLGGSGSLAVTPIVGVGGSAGLSGDGTLAVSGVPSPAVSPALSGSGALAVTTRTPGLVVTPALGGSGTLSVAATPAVSGTPALSGSGTLAVTTKTPAVATSPALGGSGTLAVTARTPAVSGVPALGGTGTLNASTGSAGSSSPALSGSGALVAAGKPAFATTPGLAGTGTLTVTALLAASSPATFSGGGVLAALTQMAISTSLAFLGSGTLTAARVSAGILPAVLVAQQPDDDPGAVAGARALGPDAWLNRRHVRRGVDTWLGPVVTRADAVLNLAVTSGATPGDSDWTAPYYVAGRPGYLLDTPGSTGRYHLWCRDGITGDPSPFATITVT